MMHGPAPDLEVELAEDSGYFLKLAIIRRQLRVVSAGLSPHH